MRWLRHFWQRRTRGWDDTELYGLDFTVAKFVLPRLKVFVSKTCSYPSVLLGNDNDYNKAEARWGEILEEIIYAMEKIASEEILGSKEEEERVQKGCELFGKWFQNIWW